MPLLFAFLIKLLSAAALSVFYKLFGQAFFEDLILHLLKWSAEKVASKTSTTEDDDFVKKIFERYKEQQAGTGKDTGAQT